MGFKIGPVTGEYYLVADDGNTAVDNKADYIAASKIYEHFSKVYSAVFEFSKTQTNIYGVNNPKDLIKGMTFGGYPVKISESSIQLGLKVLQKVTDYESENIENRYKKATKAAYSSLAKFIDKRSSMNFELT